MTVHDIENKEIREFIIDMGFDELSGYPLWVYSLAEMMVDCGWGKK